MDSSRVINSYAADGTPAPRTAGAGLQPFKYNGNEWIRSAGLNAYDFNARLYCIRPDLRHRDRFREILKNQGITQGETEASFLSGTIKEAGVSERILSPNPGWRRPDRRTIRTACPAPSPLPRASYAPSQPCTRPTAQPSHRCTLPAAGRAAGRPAR